MGSNPINLAIRFLLELAALLVIGIWGWYESESWIRFVLAFGLPIIAAIIWGIFAVLNDPSRSGKALVAIPGILRLAIELAIFSIATWTLFELGYSNLAWIYGFIVAIHYFISYDRINWLIKQ
ncbi:MAG: hypothetical protein DRI54_06580 [Bacteroidetes bacterium]|nr:MAG: hypothetical protein DRI54_06580 [Bacteroidota bacterium]